jgi:hypothetical protein
LTLCPECRTNPLPAGRRGGHCEPCKAFNRLLESLHRRTVRCRADRRAKAARVETYAARVAAGVRLFE